MGLTSENAWLGIARNPEIWRYCRGLSNDEIITLYSGGKRLVGEILRVDTGVSAIIHRLLQAHLEDLDTHLERLKRMGIKFTDMNSEDYPQALKQIYDPPYVIFYMGKLIRTRHVAMVGSRRCSAYGRSVAMGLAECLAAKNITVVSGMARGIDSAAHIGALKKGRTVAVLGSGLDVLYPPENRTLAEQIVEDGALISEFPLGTPPRPINFPARNRIISGLSEFVVVVEASRKSGALITADFALEQGRDVLVVPGSIHSPTSAGCHDLIKQGAAVLTDEAELLYHLGLDADSPGQVEGVDERFEYLLDLIDYDKTHVDEIIVRGGRQSAEILSGLAVLEVKGLIEKQLGGWYTRIK